VLLLQRAFRKANAAITIQAVTDGDKAVAYLSGADEYSDREKYPLPAVVLLDLKMPRKSGLEVLQWVRSNEKVRRLIVIIFTSSKHDEDVNKAYDIGANSYLVKPVGFDMLVDVAKMIQQYWINTNERPQLG
jgi:DNA-binding response OmpR family regulator